MESGDWRTGAGSSSGAEIIVVGAKSLFVKSPYMFLLQTLNLHNLSCILRQRLHAFLLKTSKVNYFRDECLHAFLLTTSKVNYFRDQRNHKYVVAVHMNL